jgi:hypothetical protein
MRTVFSVALVAIVLPAAAAAPLKVDVCHAHPKTGELSLHQVVDHQLDRHLDHGDAFPGVDGLDENCGELAVCGPFEPIVDDVVGEWSTVIDYEVQFEFALDGTFVKRDLVSPCPPDAVCFWSGIVTNTGTWNVGGTAVNLAYNTANDFSGAVGFPATLDADFCDDTVTLIETLADGTTVVYDAI